MWEAAWGLNPGWGWNIGSCPYQLSVSQIQVKIAKNAFALPPRAVADPMTCLEGGLYTMYWRIIKWAKIYKSGHQRVWMYSSWPPQPIPLRTEAFFLIKNSGQSTDDLIQNTAGPFPMSWSKLCFCPPNIKKIQVDNIGGERKGETERDWESVGFPRMEAG